MGEAPSITTPTSPKWGRGTPCGEFLRRYWHPVALADEATDRPRQVRLLGEDLILFRDRTGPARAALPALHPPRHDALLRPGRGPRHPLLLSRLAVRHGRTMSRTAVRARRGQAQAHGAPALVSGRGALRPDLRLYGSAGAQTGPAALRHFRGPWRGRGAAPRRLGPRQRRRRARAGGAVQLAAAYRERARHLPRADPCTARSAAPSSCPRWRPCRT